MFFGSFMYVFCRSYVVVVWSFALYYVSVECFGFLLFHFCLVLGCFCAFNFIDVFNLFLSDGLEGGTPEGGGFP